ncbi:MAG: hypothetical protein L3J39_01760 [Verrucomicrobiales bacterium]|nr:hypothetical protein [Verrucomicrobiales bacterium]
MKTSIKTFVAVLLCVLSLSEFAHARAFKNAKGKVIEAEIKTVVGDKVTIARSSDQREFTIPIISLSQQDQVFIKQWQTEKKGKASDMKSTPSGGGEPAEEVKAGAQFKIDFPDLVEDRHGKPTQVGVTIPSSYDSSKPVPLFVWMGGGDGSNNATDMGLVDRASFVTVGLPFPKGMNAPSQSNMVGDYKKIWKQYHQPILAKLFEMIPNIDRRLCILGGFSNGAHCIVGVLGEASKGGYPEVFNVYIIADGGAGFSAKRIKGGKGNYLFATWGENSPAAGQTEAAAKKASGMKVEMFEMKDSGHKFNEEGRAKAKEWLDKVVIPATLGE